MLNRQLYQEPIDDP